MFAATLGGVEFGVGYQSSSPTWNGSESTPRPVRHRIQSLPHMERLITRRRIAVCLAIFHRIPMGHRDHAPAGCPPFSISIFRVQAQFTGTKTLRALLGLFTYVCCCDLVI